MILKNNNLSKVINKIALYLVFNAIFFINQNKGAVLFHKTAPLIKTNYLVFTATFYFFNTLIFSEVF